MSVAARPDSPAHRHMTRTTGHFEVPVAGGEEVRSFVPFSLPPKTPALVVDGPRATKLRAAEDALARLALASEVLPSLDWFLNASVRREAVFSCQIAGTQATLMDLLNFEAEHGATPNPDVEEIYNYLEALRYTRSELNRVDGGPLTINLLNEAHRRMMRGARGMQHRPGEVRRSANWSRGKRPENAAHIPPSVPRLPDLLGDLERYLHADDDLPALVRVGLAHVQFETIHPYLAGNGRIGRLLIPLLLEHWGLIHAPLLHLSLFFRQHQTEYSRRLDSVRRNGDWEGWTDFFLDGVATVAAEACTTAQDLSALVARDRARVLAQDTTSVAAARLFELLPNHPLVTVAKVMRLLATTKPTATRAIRTLVDAGVLVEATGRKRNRRFVYNAYLTPLLAHTERSSRQFAPPHFLLYSGTSTTPAPPTSVQNPCTISFNDRTATVATADCLDFIDGMPDESIDLLLTSPPYFIGKEYDDSTKVSDFERTIRALVQRIIRVLRPRGSLCFQIGNHVRHNQVLPLDYAVARAMEPHGLFVLRNRIIWTYSHGQHLRKRFSGRHESILWYTRGNDYFFDLDAARVPQKYPGKKHYKGPKKGQFSGNPLGKNPGDFWDFGVPWDIPNVKANHIEKIDHPCQFPIALARRLIVALCPADGTVLDPFLGSGTTAIAALLDARHFIGCDVSDKYTGLATSRLHALVSGALRHRPDVPIQAPRPNDSVALAPPHFQHARRDK